MHMRQKLINRKKRHYRIRKRVVGKATAPRLSVYRALANLHVQLVDDISEKTLIGLSTTSKEVKEKAPYGGNVKAAVALGEVLARKMKEQGIAKVCFDRGGFSYQGRIKVLADTLRKNGINV